MSTVNSKPLYTEQDKARVDGLLMNLIKARYIQEALNIFFRGNPPPNEVAGRFVVGATLGRIEVFQPRFADPTAKTPQQAFQITARLPITGFELVHDWVTVAIVSIALRDFEVVGSYLFGAYQTAFLLGDTTLLLMATKLVFAVSSMLVESNPPDPALGQPILAGFPNLCIDQLVGDKHKALRRGYSVEMCNLCCGFYLILIGFAELHHAAPKMVRQLGSKLREIAATLDTATDGKFSFSGWTEEILRQRYAVRY